MADRPTKDSVVSECEQLGVRFEDVREAAYHTNVAAWAKLFSWSDNYEYSVWMTVRAKSVIIFPLGVADPFDHWKTIAHELVHWHQQPDNRIAYWIWALKYTGQRRRWEIEAPAHLVGLQLGVHRHIDVLVDDMRRFYRLSDITPDEMQRWFVSELRQGRW